MASVRGILNIQSLSLNELFQLTSHATRKIFVILDLPSAKSVPR